MQTGVLAHLHLYAGLTAIKTYIHIGGCTCACTCTEIEGFGGDGFLASGQWKDKKASIVDWGSLRLSLCAHPTLYVTEWVIEHGERAVSW